MFSEWFMPENTRLSGSIDQIELGFVEREATPQLLMKLGIQLHFAFLSFSDIVSIIEIFGVSRVDPPLTTGFIRQSYSPKLVVVRITSRLTRQ